MQYFSCKNVLTEESGLSYMKNYINIQSFFLFSDVSLFVFYWSVFIKKYFLRLQMKFAFHFPVHVAYKLLAKNIFSTPDIFHTHSRRCVYIVVSSRLIDRLHILAWSQDLGYKIFIFPKTPRRDLRKSKTMIKWETFSRKCNVNITRILWPDLKYRLWAC